MSDDEIKVTDRRAMNENGESAAPAEGGAASLPEEAAEQAYSEATEKCGAKEGRAMPPIDFSTFVLSLSQAVLLHLGELEDPETKQLTPNLAMARQSIDLLSMLQEKTRGNLTEEEAKLLENLLYDLRMKYVAVCRGR
ncbi:MAG: DUF1844 domain-containing protein [bacterium]